MVIYHHKNCQNTSYIVKTSEFEDIWGLFEHVIYHHKNCQNTSYIVKTSEFEDIWDYLNMYLCLNTY